MFTMVGKTLIYWVAIAIATASVASPAPSRADFWSKTWHEIEIAGKAINRGAIAVGKGVEHLGQEIGKSGDRLGK